MKPRTKKIAIGLAIFAAIAALAWAAWYWFKKRKSAGFTDFKPAEGYPTDSHPTEHFTYGELSKVLGGNPQSNGGIEPDTDQGKQLEFGIALVSEKVRAELDGDPLLVQILGWNGNVDLQGMSGPNANVKRTGVILLRARSLTDVDFTKQQEAWTKWGRKVDPDATVSAVDMAGHKWVYVTILQSQIAALAATYSPKK